MNVHLEQPRGAVRNMHDVHNVCLAGGGSDMFSAVQLVCTHVQYVDTCVQHLEIRNQWELDV